jgi:predicted secreted Zn-dependent protease
LLKVASGLRARGGRARNPWGAEPWAALVFAGAALGVLAVAMTSLHVSALPGGVHVAVRLYRPYGFSASSYRDVRESLDSKAMARFDDGETVALSSYASYPVPVVVPTRGRCRVHRAMVVTVVSIEWPRWSGGTSDSSDSDHEKWSRREGRIFAHELSHAQLAELGGLSLLSDLTALADVPCTHVIAEIARFQREARDVTQATNDIFDERGGHQGALEDVEGFWRELNDPP